MKKYCVLLFTSLALAACGSDSGSGEPPYVDTQDPNDLLFKCADGDNAQNIKVSGIADDDFTSLQVEYNKEIQELKDTEKYLGKDRIIVCGASGYQDPEFDQLKGYFYVEYMLNEKTTNYYHFKTGLYSGSCLKLRKRWKQNEIFPDQTLEMSCSTPQKIELNRNPQNVAGAPDLEFGDRGILTVQIQDGLSVNGATIDKTTNDIYVHAETKAKDLSVHIYKLNSESEMSRAFGDDGYLGFDLPVERYDLDPTKFHSRVRTLHVEKGALYVTGDIAKINRDEEDERRRRRRKTYHSFVMKFDVNGRLDTSFAEQGLFMYQKKDKFFAHGFNQVAISSKNEIYLASNLIIDSNTEGFIYQTPGVVRLSPQGVLDEEFLAKQIENFMRLRLHGIGSGIQLINDLPVLAGSYQISPGFAHGHSYFIKYKSDGSLDTRFGKHGIAKFEFRMCLGKGSQLRKSNKNKLSIVFDCGQYSRGSAYILQVAENGKVDMSFHTDGKLGYLPDYSLFNYSSKYFYKNVHEYAEDGSLYVGGTGSGRFSNTSYYRIAKLMNKAEADPNFGIGGVTRVRRDHMPRTSFSAVAMLKRNDGQLLYMTSHTSSRAGETYIAISKFKK